MVFIVRRDSITAVDDAAQVAGHQDDVASFDGDVGAGTDSEANIGLGQSGGVVDAVADKTDAAAIGLQTFDLGGLLVGKHFGQDFVDADRSGNGFGSDAVVAGDHCDL